MKVSDIHAIELREGDYMLMCRVKVTDNESFKSHAGIFVYLNNEQVTGAMSFEHLATGGTQSHLLLAIRYRLAEIANNGLVAF